MAAYTFTESHAGAYADNCADSRFSLFFLMNLFRQIGSVLPSWTVCVACDGHIIICLLGTMVTDRYWSLPPSHRGFF